MFKVNKKDTKTAKLAGLGALIVNYGWDFTPCSSALIFDFQHVNVNFVKF